MDDSDDIRRQLHCSVVKGDTLLQNDVLASEAMKKVHAGPEVTVGPPILPAVSIARPWILPVSEADHTLLVSLASPRLLRREKSQPSAATRCP
eukprot:scaffold8546_cov197-Skeletonema_menzelii.AAC.1